MTRNRVIGRDGDLPWHLPDEMAHFRRTTLGHPIIMGRRTFDSHDRRVLPKRQNIVISRSKIDVEGIFYACDLATAIEFASGTGAEECFVIGGSVIYLEALPLADRLYQTVIDTELVGDTFFPDFDLSYWAEKKTSFHPKDDRHQFAFNISVLERI